MKNRLIYLALLFAFTIVLPAVSHAQVLVFSHTNIESEFLLPACASEMQDPFTELDYPSTNAFCQLLQNNQVLQSWNCSGYPTAVCTPATTDPEFPTQNGATYQTTAIHGLLLPELAGGCVIGNVTVNPCFLDSLNYTIPAVGPPFAPQIKDTGFIQPRGGLASVTGLTVAGTTNFLIGNSAETAFTVPFVTPSGHNGVPKDTVTFTADRVVDWSLTGIGTITGPTEAQSIVYHVPSTLQGDQTDILHACDTNRVTHGAICTPVRIRTNALDVVVNGPVELFPSQTFDYVANVVGPIPPVPFDGSVTWSLTDSTKLTTLDPQTGHFTVPESNLFTLPFDVVIKATSNLDPARSGTLQIHIPVTTVKVNDPIASVPFITTPNGIVYLATPGATLNFSATVEGPILAEDRVPRWVMIAFDPTTGLSKVGDIDGGSGVYTFPSKPPVLSFQKTEVLACVGGLTNVTGLVNFDQICSPPYVIQMAPATSITSAPIIVNSGELSIISITGTGFSASPTVTFADPNITAVVNSVTGPDPTTGITTISATVTSAPLPANEVTTMNVTSTLPPPAVPATQTFRARGVTLNAGVAPAAATVLVSGTQQFVGNLGCQTFGGQNCVVSQTFTCTITPAVGTMNASTCLYTAPASIAAAQTLTGQACSAFGARCAPFAINLVPVTVTLSPASVGLGAGQTQQFVSTVTNVPNNNQGTTWSISPAVGSINSTGLYTAPASVTGPQVVTVKGCSVVDPSRCATAAVNLALPDFTLSVSPTSELVAAAFQVPLTITVTPVGGFNGPVAFSSTFPTGINLAPAFSPATITGSGTATATFPITPSTPAGTYPVTIIATSGGLTHSVPISVTVVLPSLSLTVSPPQTASGGSTVVYTFNVANNNFFGAISINVTGIPAGIGAVQVPGTTFGPGPGTLTLTIPAGFAPGNYPLTFTASGGGVITVGNSSLNVSATATASTSLTIPKPPPPPPPPPPPGCPTRFCIDPE